MTRTVLLTGCSTGFGKVAAEHFAHAGWNVVATMRRPEDGAGLAALGDRVLVTRLDVQDTASIDAAIAAGVERFGGIDVLVNNAGFGLHGIFEAIPRDKVTEQLAVNVFGVMDVTRAILPHMRSRKSGVIINVSSGAGVFTLPMLSLYCASKFALEGFSEALSYELAPLGITVKIAEPGGVVSTSFGQRAQAETSGQAHIADYDPFVARSLEVFEGLRRERAGGTAEGFAEVLYQAATDGTDQLRYLGTPDIGPLLDLRRQTSEAEYIATMRSRFAPKVD